MSSVPDSLLLQLQAWLDQQQLALLHHPKDEALPALEERLPPEVPAQAARDGLLRGGYCYVGRFLRGRSCLMSWAALTDCLAAVHDLAASDQNIWRAFLAGESPARPILTRWEQRLWIVRDRQGLLRPSEEQLPELLAEARRLGTARGALRAVARFLLAAPRVDDKLLVSYLGLERKRAKHCLRRLRALELCEPCGSGFVKGSLRGRPERLRAALAQPNFPEDPGPANK